jgi:hypothetical protein
MTPEKAITRFQWRTDCEKSPGASFIFCTTLTFVGGDLHGQVPPGTCKVVVTLPATSATK